MRSAVTVEGDRTNRDLSSLLFFVTVHCSAARATASNGLMYLCSSSCDVPKVRSSAFALYQALVELLPISSEHIVNTPPYLCKVVVEMFTRGACIVMFTML